MINFESLSLLADLYQIASFKMNIKEVSNDIIMKKLENQDIVLDEQTNNYLKLIVKQNEQIIFLLNKIFEDKIENLKK